MLFTIKMKKRGRSRAATLRCLGLRTVHRVARERGKVRGRRLGLRPSQVTSGSARYRSSYSRRPRKAPGLCDGRSMMKPTGRPHAGKNCVYQRLVVDSSGYLGRWRCNTSLCSERFELPSQHGHIRHVSLTSSNTVLRHYGYRKKPEHTLKLPPRTTSAYHAGRYRVFARRPFAVHDQCGRSMVETETYVMHWFTTLLAYEILERSRLWPDHDLVKNRKIAVDFVSRIRGVSAEVFERYDCGISNHFPNFITWVATRVKVSQSQRYLSDVHNPSIYSPVFVVRFGTSRILKYSS
jgi:hypothetical protein